VFCGSRTTLMVHPPGHKFAGDKCEYPGMLPPQPSQTIGSGKVSKVSPVSKFSIHAAPFDHTLFVRFYSAGVAFRRDQMEYELYQYQNAQQSRGQGLGHGHWWETILYCILIVRRAMVFRCGKASLKSNGLSSAARSFLTPIFRSVPPGVYYHGWIVSLEIACVGRDWQRPNLPLRDKSLISWAARLLAGIGREDRKQRKGPRLLQPFTHFRGCQSLVPRIRFLVGFDPNPRA